VKNNLLIILTIGLSTKKLDELQVGKKETDRFSLSVLPILILVICLISFQHNVVIH
jgi:hypothetical protein